MLPQLMGLGEAGLDAEIEGFMLRVGTNPSSTQIVEFLRLYPAGEKRDAAARALLAKGAHDSAVSNALNFLDVSKKFDPRTLWGIASVISAGLGAYHGYKRNNSIGWAIVWSALGGIFPIFTPAVALAQGFGKRKGA